MTRRPYAECSGELKATLENLWAARDTNAAAKFQLLMKTYEANGSDFEGAANCAFRWESTETPSHKGAYNDTAYILFDTVTRDWAKT